MLASLVIAAAAAATQPLPPPVIAPPILPLPLVANADEAMAVHVRIMAGGNQLLSDTFRVGRNGGASYQQSRSEAPAFCPEQQQRYGAQQRYGLSLNLYQRYEAVGAPMINVSVQWQRPSPTAACTAEGSRQVQLTQTVPLAVGQSVTLQGDAGLTVILSR